MGYVLGLEIFTPNPKIDMGKKPFLFAPLNFQKIKLLLYCLFVGWHHDHVAHYLAWRVWNLTSN